MKATHEDVLRQFALLRRAERNNPQWSEEGQSVLLISTDGYRVLRADPEGLVSVYGIRLNADGAIDAINRKMTAAVGD
jgi:hypothetical protein